MKCSGLLPAESGQKSAAKKLPETDAIFAQVTAVNRAADAADTVLRLSMDAKATVKVGPFARGGKKRIPTVAADHAFHPDATVPPVGIFLPALEALSLYGITSKVTSDCLVDCLRRWWEVVPDRFAHITTLVLNLEKGPENQSRRTQCMRRLVDFAQDSGWTMRLAYYPPYHRPTVSLGVTCAVVYIYGYDDGRISPPHCAVIAAGPVGR
jgi:hypothetical protein